MYEFYLNGVLLPVTPSAFSIKIANQNKTIKLINEGEVNILKQPGLSKISFNALFPNRPYPFARYPNGFQGAGYYQSLLESLKTGCKPFLFQIIRTDDSGTVLMQAEEPMSVSLEEYELSEDADKHGVDVMANIELLQYRDYGTKAIEFKKEESAVTATVTEQRDASGKKVESSYTVKSGDTLWDIARISLGNGARSGELYALNQEVIEATAKKRGRASSSKGHWIYPGTVLKLPS